MPEGDILVLDLETQKSFDQVGGRENLHLLLVSVAGLYSYRQGRLLAFTESELHRLFALMEQARLIVGFNIKRFDYKVLEPYHHRRLAGLPTLDILEEIVKVLGHRLPLHSLAQATLGRGKTGSGLDAIRYFREGNLEKLKAYCLEDVKLTRDLYEYGKKHNRLLYLDREGRKTLAVSVQWQDPPQDQYSLMLD